jgi:polyhydroxybutyrate depolymerase
MKAFVWIAISVSVVLFDGCSSSMTGTGGDATVSVGSGGAAGSNGASGGSAGSSESGGAAGSSVSGGSAGSTGASGGAAGMTTGSTGSGGASGGAAGTAGSGGAGVDAAPPSDAGAVSSDAAQAPCAAGTLRPGNSTLMIPHAGAMRSYILHVPPQYDGRTRMPVVVDMHGLGQTAAGQPSQGGWNRKADAVGIIMIYPQGLNNSWNGGPCCGPSQMMNVDDVGFLKAAVTKTAQDGCVDLKRVYASGLSNGGVMSHYLGCVAADFFAAVAPVSAGNRVMPCTPARPITVVNVRGRQDNLVVFNGNATWPSAMADFEKWSQADGCTGTPTMSHGMLCQTRTQCSGGVEVTLCSIDGGHVLYGAAAQQMAAVPDVAWEAFARHSLP